MAVSEVSLWDGSLEEHFVESVILRKTYFNKRFDKMIVL